MTEETEVVESPQTEETTDLADVSTDDLRAMMTETEQTEAETPDQPETETETETAEAEEERLAKRRIRPKSALDQQVLDLYKSEAFDGTFADASKVIYRQSETPQKNLNEQSGVEDNRPDPINRYDERISELSTEVILLEEQVTEAADNLETAEALKLQREITRRELEAQGLKSAKESEIQRRRDAEYTTHRDKAVESRDRALNMFPDLQDKESIPRKQFDEFVQRAQDDSDYTAIFASPKWPEIMAREFASSAGLKQGELPQAPPQQSPAMGTQAKVLTTGSTAQPVNTPATEKQLAAGMGKLSKDQLYALLGQPDGSKMPLR